MFTNFSEVFLASLVLPIFTEKFELVKLPVVLLGITITFICSYLSVLFAQIGKL